MKRCILILLTIISFSACSTDNDVPNYYFEYIEITEVDIPSEFILDETYEITISYTLPNNCYQFYHYDYIYEDTSRIIGAIAIVNDDTTCVQSTIDGEFIINVVARQSEPYIFKFWQGEDNQGVNQYLIVEVPVI